jgi:hypothetical protein
MTLSIEIELFLLNGNYLFVSKNIVKVQNIKKKLKKFQKNIEKNLNIVYNVNISFKRHRILFLYKNKKIIKKTLNFF